MTPDEKIQKYQLDQLFLTLIDQYHSPEWDSNMESKACHKHPKAGRNTQHTASEQGGLVVRCLIIFKPFLSFSTMQTHAQACHC